MRNLAPRKNFVCTGAGHNALLISRNPGGTCRDIYGRELWNNRFVSAGK
jgi:hypothetical protein